MPCVKRAAVQSAMAVEDVPAADAVRQALLRQQEDPDEHDRSLIVKRLAWTPEQRLAANAAFLRFYLALRPAGPLVRD
jgi:hypothetical protein